MADADYGVDFSGVEDLDFNLTTVSGPTAVAQAIARELLTPFGTLFYAPTYGNDVRRFLGAMITSPGSIAASVEATALKDQRVENARARVTFINETLTIEMRVFLAAGPFDMTLSVDKLKAELLVAA